MDFTKQKILVTGADGFIGSHLVESLLDKECQVRAFVFYIKAENMNPSLILIDSAVMPIA